MRTVYSILLAFLLLCGSVVAKDQRKVDSLQTLLQTDIADTTRVKTLNALGVQLIFNNPDTMIILGQQALVISKKIKLIKGRAIIYRHIGVAFWVKGDYPKALDYYYMALKIDRELGDKSGIAADLANIGTVYHNQGEIAKALEYYLEALKLSKELGNKSNAAVHIGNIGIAYMDQGDVSSEASVKRELYKKALDYFIEHLRMAKELGIKEYQATALANLGVVYQTQGEYQRALEYYFESLKIYHEIGDQIGVIITLGNIGLLHTRTGQFKAAESYLDSALTMSNSIGALDQIQSNENALSRLYDTTGRYQLALEHYKAQHCQRLPFQRRKI